MSDFPSRPELDDELLSAYLDDELSPQERAGVEARLADDARAREMLHQLRAVSQAVQGLPQEIVGHDLGESVLRRVTQDVRVVAPLVSPMNDSNGRSSDRVGQTEDSSPKFTIGRSPRGWFWASLAVAAALLVMFQQADRQGIEDPRAVAVRDDKAVRDEVGRGISERAELEIRSLNEPATPAPNDGLAVDAARPAVRENVARNMERQSQISPALEPAAQLNEERVADVGIAPATSPSGPRGGAASPSATDFDTSATVTMQSETSGQVSASGAAVDPTVDATVDSLAATPLGVADIDRTEELADAPTVQEQPVVIRVLARREVLESKAFDRLLASNGIAIDAATADNAPIATVRAQNDSALAEQKATELLREKAPQSPSSGREEEVLLVEAPASAITSSLETLSADEVNYVGIQVDKTAALQTNRRLDTGAMADDSIREQEALTKKQRVQQDWTKYNRGSVPQTGYAFSGDKFYFYDRGNDGVDHYGTESRFGGGGYGGAGAAGFGRPQELAQPSVPADPKSLNEQSRGRALRLQSWAIEREPQAEQQMEQLSRRRYAMPQQSVAATGQPGQQLEKLSELSSAADRVQVLFVISPADAAASSPPARNKAQ